ncbi:MAG: sulfite exporter TauE/SafE family protein [Chloroflexota bacterium]|nr:sulfite exporter TauE/SafE family protein [Chloroflexota bacterium]
MTRFILLALFGLVAQLVDGSLGMAYGLTSTSLLLTIGIVPAVASASVHLAEVGTTLASGVSHWKFGNVDWRAVRWLAIPGGVGAFTGAVFLSSISAAVIGPFIAVFLFLLGCYLLVRFAILGGKITVKPGTLSGRFLLPLGLGAGFLDAVGGGGWGPISTPTLLASGKMEPRKAIGTSSTSEFVVAVCASAGFLIALDTSVLALPVVGALLLGGVIAAPIAAWLSRRLHPRLLGSGVGGLIILTNGRTLLAALGVESEVQMLAIAAVAVVWIAALVIAIRSVRADGGRLASAPAD